MPRVSLWCAWACRVGWISPYPIVELKRPWRLPRASPRGVAWLIVIPSPSSASSAPVAKRSNQIVGAFGGRESIFSFSHTERGQIFGKVAHERAVAGATCNRGRWTYERGADESRQRVAGVNDH